MISIGFSISTLTAINNKQKAKYDINKHRYHQVSIIYMQTVISEGSLAIVTEPCPLKKDWNATQHNHSSSNTNNFVNKHVQTYLIRHIDEPRPLHSDTDDPKLIHLFLYTYTTQYKSLKKLTICIGVSIAT